MSNIDQFEKEEILTKFKNIIRTLQFHGFTLETQAANTMYNYFEEFYKTNLITVELNEFIQPYLDEFYRVLPSLSIITNQILVQCHNNVLRNSGN